MNFIYMNDLSGEMFAVTKPDDMTTLTFLQTLVDGFVECVGIQGGLDIWVNEDGLFRDDFRTNRKATIMRGAGYAVPLVGPAVLATHDKEGRTFGVPQDYYFYSEALLNDGRPFTLEEVIEIRNKMAKVVI